MRTAVLTRDAAITGLCNDLAQTGLTAVQELASANDLSAFTPEDLADLLVLMDLSHVETLDQQVLEELCKHAGRVVVHSKVIPPDGFVQQGEVLGIDVVIGPVTTVLKRKLQDCLRLGMLAEKLSHTGQQSPDELEELDHFRQRVRSLDLQREKLSSVLETMNLLSRLSREISLLDLDEIINVCVTKVPHIVGARYASFYLHDFDQKVLRLNRHNHGYRIDEVVPILNNSSSAMVQALLARRIVLVTDFKRYEQTHHLTVERPHAAHYASTSCLIAPMMAGNRVVAVLNLADKRNGTCFDELNDLPPMEQLSALVGAAIRNYQLYQDVSRQARTDSMTNFYNHQAFFEELEKETLRVRRYQGALSLMMTDVDNFKTFNDRYGHQVGDQILRKTANIIRTNIRDTDVPARYGGDEFAVILSQTDADRARLIAERIRKTIESSTVTCGDKSLSLTLSIGVAQYQPGMSVTEFVNEADRALYEAKSEGRNRVAIFASAD